MQFRLQLHLWAGSLETIMACWMLELCAFHTSECHTGVKGTQLEHPACHCSLKFYNPASQHPPTLVLADLTLNNNEALLRSPVTSLTAVLTRLGALQLQLSRKSVSCQKAPSFEDVNPQVQAPPGS